MTLMEPSETFVAATTINHLVHYDYAASDIKEIRELNHSQLT